MITTTRVEWHVERPGSKPFDGERKAPCLDTGNYRLRVLRPLAEKLGIERLNFQILLRMMAPQAQGRGSVKDIQAHLRHTKADTTANEYLQALPESEREMVGSVYQRLAKGGKAKKPFEEKPQNATIFFQ